MTAWTEGCTRKARVRLWKATEASLVRRPHSAGRKGLSCSAFGKGRRRGTAGGVGGAAQGSEPENAPAHQPPPTPHGGFLKEASSPGAEHGRATWLPRAGLGPSTRVQSSGELPGVQGRSTSPKVTAGTCLDESPVPRTCQARGQPARTHSARPPAPLYLAAWHSLNNGVLSKVHVLELNAQAAVLGGVASGGLSHEGPTCTLTQGRTQRGAWPTPLHSPRRRQQRAAILDAQSTEHQTQSLQIL